MSTNLHDILHSETSDKLKESLLELKFMLKEAYGSRSLLDKAAQSYSFLREDYGKYLSHPTAKVRQHAADCIAFFATDADIDMLLKAYGDDDTLYNKEHYLLSLSSLDVSPYKDFLAGRLSELISSDIPPEEHKHRVPEIRALVSLLRKNCKERTYIDGVKESEIVLLTNRNFKDLTMNELKGLPHKDFSAGCMVKTSHVARLYSVRTFEELLFKPPVKGNISTDCQSAAQTLLESGIVDYIYDRLSEGELPVNFRLEVKTKDPQLKTAVMRSLPLSLETGSKFRLLNSTDDYDIEIRLVESSDGGFRPLIKFCMLKDKRFSYRKINLSVSMRPYIAALICKLTQKYMVDNSVVLDPFCGTGTLLVERDKIKPVRLMYGVDIYGKAVEAALVNITAAGVQNKTELINKDFLKFSHSHKFNEVITDMPFDTVRKSEEEISSLFERFFKNLRNFLMTENVLILYTHNRDYLCKYAAQFGYKTIEEFEISKKEGAYLFVLRYGD